MIDLTRYNKNTEKAISCLTSCMSIAKWHKLFECIEQSEIEILDTYCTDIVDYDMENPIHYGIVPEVSYDGRGEYSVDGDETPMRLKNIYYLTLILKNNNTALLLENKINKLGQFEYKIDDNKIIIYGYKGS